MTSTPLRPLIWAALFAAVHSSPAHPAVQVTVGPTPIPDGEAAAARDITVMNETPGVRPRGRESGAVRRAAWRNHRPRAGRERPARTRPCRLRRLHPEQLVGLAEHLSEGGRRRAWPATGRRQDDARLGQGRYRDDIHAARGRGPDRAADDHDQQRRHSTSPTCCRARRCGPVPDTSSASRALAICRKARRPVHWPTAPSPTTKTGASRCMRRTWTSSARGRKTCSCGTRCNPANRARSMRGCRSVRVAT